MADHGDATRGRNPTWARDELILALDLYLRRGVAAESDEEVRQLSNTLRGLPVHLNPPDPERFRNTNAVVLKLANFRAIEQPGHGMRGGGEGDRRVWDELHRDPRRLQRLADAIRGAAALPEAQQPTDEELEEEREATEGRLLYRLHRRWERDPHVVADKKRATIKRLGRLACEVCDFDFLAFYGSRGEGYAQCHHRRPLSETGETTTRLADLAIVCANCHCIIHRARPWPSIDQLREEVAERRKVGLASGRPAP